MPFESAKYRYYGVMMTARQLYELDACEVSLGALYEHLKSGIPASKAIKKQQKGGETYFYDNRWQTARELLNYPECIVGLSTLRYRLSTKSDCMTVFECLSTPAQQGKPLSKSSQNHSLTNPLTMSWVNQNF